MVSCFFFGSLIEFAKSGCGCVKPIMIQQKIQIIAQHQPRPANTSHPHPIHASSAQNQTPPATPYRRHPPRQLRSSTTSDTLDNTLRNAFQPHTQPTSTNNTPATQRNITSNTPPSTIHLPNTLRDTSQPHSSIKHHHRHSQQQPKQHPPRHFSTTFAIRRRQKHPKEHAQHLLATCMIRHHQWHPGWHPPPPQHTQKFRDRPPIDLNQKLFREIQPSL